MVVFQDHPQWPAVEQIYERLLKAGFKAYIAGGAVRDMFLGREPNDIDIATSARPSEVEKLFAKTVMVGRDFGVSRVIVEGHDIEVATFRKDGPYIDGRKPKSIEFADVEEDAKRRDFTINALFYDPRNQECLDFVGGQEDIRKGVIRAVGDADKRFAEDKLRILRAVRFHSQLGFSFDPATSKAIRENAVRLSQVSMERTRDEWVKLLRGQFVDSALDESVDLKIWKALFSNLEFGGEAYRGFFGPSLDTEQTWVLWFLFHWRDSMDGLKTEVARWKLPNQITQKILFCFRAFPMLKSVEGFDAVDLALFMDDERGQMAMDIYERLYSADISQVYYDKLAEAQSFFNNGKLIKALVTGDDLIAYGFSPGPKVAAELKRLYRIQLTEQVAYREALLKLAKH